MRKQTSKIVLVLVIVAVLIGVLAFSLMKSEIQKITNFESCVTAGNPVMESYPRQCTANGKTYVEAIKEEPSIVEEYFIERFPQRAIEILGAMPIEGFNPELYMQVYLGLKERDFHNAEAIGGIWEFSNNKLIFVQTPGPISSADGTLNEKGLAILLQNLAQRLEIQPVTKNNIDRIINILKKSSDSSKEKHFCTPENRETDVCIQLYQPVCGWFNPEKIQCIKYPCANTYSNSCFACTNPDVLYWTEGECPQ